MGNQIKLWMSDESTLTWLVEGDFSSEESVSLSDIVKIELGKTTDTFRVGAGASAIEELSFSLITHRITLDLEASARRGVHHAAAWPGPVIRDYFRGSRSSLK